MRREHDILESFKSLHKTRALLAQEEIRKINEAAAAKNNFMNNYYNILDNRRTKEAQHAKLMEAARSDGLAMVLKAIYITAMEAEAMTDNGILLAESMVDGFINEQGGASNILNSKVANKTYLLSRITQIVEEYATNVVNEMESDSDEEVDDDEEIEVEDKEEEKEAVDTSKIDDIKDFVDNADKDELKQFIFDMVENIKDKAKEKSEEEEVETEEDEDSVDAADPEDVDTEVEEDEKDEDSDDETENESEDDDTEEEDTSEDETTEEESDKEESETEETDGEEESDDSESEEVKEVEVDDSEETSDDTDTAEDEEVEDVEDDTTEDEVEDTEETSDDATEDEDDAEEEDLEDDFEADGEIDTLEDEEEIDDDLGESLDDDDTDSDITVDGSVDNDGKIFDELKKEDDVQKAIDLIRTRVANAEETFIRNNAEDKKKIDELLNKISNNVKTVEDLEGKDDSKADVARESAAMAKRKINEIKSSSNNILTVFEKMTRILGENIIKNPDTKEMYLEESGSLDIDLVVESAKVMYGFLETLNTLQLVYVDEEYIAKVIDDMKNDR